jgi:hypothetical protein
MLNANVTPARFGWAVTFLAVKGGACRLSARVPRWEREMQGIFLNFSHRLCNIIV